MRRKGQLHRGRGDAANAGFSLVELLIAVTILAIIVIPLLHLFVTSTRINVKSRQTLRATTVAQDIMEGLKAYTLEEVRTQFNAQDAAGNFVLVDGWHYPEEGFYVLNSDMIQDGVRELTSLEGWLDQATGKPVDPASAANEVYYFGISDLKMQGGEYDALIKLDASTYTQTRAKDGDDVAGKKNVTDATGHDHAFNGRYYADVMSVSETSGSAETDSSYHEPADLDRQAAKAMQKLIEDEAYPDGTYPDGWEEMWKESGTSQYKPIGEVAGLKVDGRTIKVSLAEDGSSPGALLPGAEELKPCLAKVAVQYDCTYGGKLYHMYYGRDDFREGEVQDSAVQTVGIPRKFNSGNFYLFYYPDYEAGMDTIQFMIEDGSLLDVAAPALRSITLVKQIRSTVDTDKAVIAPDLTDAELFAKESGYSPAVKIGPAGVGGDLIFRSNIEINPSKLARQVDPETGEVDYDPPVSVNTQFPNSLNITDVKMVGDEISGDPVNVIYDIEITVYQKGAAAHFGESDFENNEEVHRLATITNLN